MGSKWIRERKRLQQGAGTSGETRVKIMLPNLLNFNSSFLMRNTIPLLLSCKFPNNFFDK